MILFVILIFGLIAVVALGIIDYASDTVTPIMEELGVVGETNMSEISGYTFTPLNKIIQALPWLIGACYVVALIFSIIFVMSYSYNPHPAFMGFYIVMILLLIFGSIIISNAYQDIYTQTDEIALRLQDQTLMSYMILYSPVILTLIAFITGIYLFSRTKEDSGGYGI